jgi:hypothetical protein
MMCKHPIGLLGPILLSLAWATPEAALDLGRRASRHRHLRPYPAAETGVGFCRLAPRAVVHLRPRLRVARSEAPRRRLQQQV